MFLVSGGGQAQKNQYSRERAAAADDIAALRVTRRLDSPRGRWEFFSGSKEIKGADAPGRAPMESRGGDDPARRREWPAPHSDRSQVVISSNPAEATRIPPGTEAGAMLDRREAAH